MSNNGCALIWCDALWHDYKKSWWHWHVEAMSIMTQNFMVVKTYTIINYLPQYGHVPSSFTTIISPMYWISKNHKTFDFSDGVSYMIF